MNQFQKTTKKLDSLRGTFFLLGLIIACSFTFLAFEWTTTEYTTPKHEPIWEIEEIEDYPPITFSTPIKPPEVKIEQSNFNQDEILIAETITNPTDPSVEPATEPEPTFDPREWETTTKVDPPLPPSGYAGTMPHFKACKTLKEKERVVCTQEKMYEHFSKKIHIPIDLKMRGKAEYLAYVYFEVNTKGEIINVKILNDAKHKIPRALEQQALNAVKTLPQLIPGNNYGKRVAVRYQVPIKFIIK